jgi:sugar/nucleoside kinase (ribokinase family)
MRPLAVIGHLSRDVVDGGEPRIGGAPWYATRALRLLERRATIVGKCGEADRRRYAARLAAQGLPTIVVGSGETTSFSISYTGQGSRQMRVEAIGEPWRPRELAGLRDAAWVHVAPLLRSDFPEPTLAALARERRILLDGQGLVRVPEVGPLRLDADFDPAVLRHLTVLKLAEEEARVLAGGIEPEALAALGVPEILLTLGDEGSLVLADGRVHRIPSRPVHARDPTGAGDGFAAAYVAARAEGHIPVSAARRATSLVADLLSGRTR